MLQYSMRNSAQVKSGFVLKFCFLKFRRTKTRGLPVYRHDGKGKRLGKMTFGYNFTKKNKTFNSVPWRRCSPSGGVGALGPAWGRAEQNKQIDASKTQIWCLEKQQTYFPTGHFVLWMCYYNGLFLRVFLLFWARKKNNALKNKHWQMRGITWPVKKVQNWPKKNILILYTLISVIFFYSRAWRLGRRWPSRPTSRTFRTWQTRWRRGRRRWPVRPGSWNGGGTVLLVVADDCLSRFRLI